jgi:uncharacterized protein (DUF302 family)
MTNQQNNNQHPQTPDSQRPQPAAVKIIKQRSIFGPFIAGVIIGILILAAVGFYFMPKLMITTRPVSLQYDKAVELLQQRITENGWVVADVKQMHKSLQKHNVDFQRRVTLIELCHPQYAKTVLDAHTNISTMMPCTFAIWEDQNENVFLSQMNLKLMARMFGPVVADVMGKKVVVDEEKILEGIITQ